MARKRQFSTFSLSFLDIMSCGLGAVALVFLIIKHDVNNSIEVKNQDLLSEVSLLEKEVLIGEKNLVEVKNILSAVDEQLAEAEGLARQINDSITAIRDKIIELESDDSDQQILALKTELRDLEAQKKALEDEIKKGNEQRLITGQGQRQYLTGLQLGGERILVLVDASASMLDKTIVNVIRRKNMSDASKRTAPKWLRAVAAVDWLMAQLPADSHYQVHTFNTQSKPLIAGTEGQWLSLNDGKQLEQVMLNLNQIVPNEGTSLQRALMVVSSLNPLPDNVLLITDGLPTQGLKNPKRNTITGADRMDLFADAVEILPNGVPINVLLWPMEGDPMAASAFWKLATVTSGSFLSPSEDWP